MLPPHPSYPPGRELPAVLRIDEKGGGLLWETDLLSGGLIMELELGAQEDGPFSYRLMADLHCPEIHSNINRPIGRWPERRLMPFLVCKAVRLYMESCSARKVNLKLDHTKGSDKLLLKMDFERKGRSGWGQLEVELDALFLSQLIGLCKKHPEVLKHHKNLAKRPER